MGGSQSHEPAAAPAAAAAGGEMVRLNVYSPSGGQHVAYHSGVELYGGEYVFGGGGGSSGVTAQRPRVPPAGSGWTFYQTVDIGPCLLSREEALRCVQQLQRDFPAQSYDLTQRNCNHFAEEMCQRLCHKGIPSWVNRLATLGQAVRSAVGAAPTATTHQAEAGGPAAAGLVAANVTGDLDGEVDWSLEKEALKRQALYLI